MLGYQYCGPGTKLAKRLVRGDSGINPLDAACKEQNIEYSKTRENPEAKKIADKLLIEQAWKRVLAKDASLPEKAAAFGVANIMKAKTKFGMGMKKKAKKVGTLTNIIAAAKKSMTLNGHSSKVIKSALKGARDAVEKAGGQVNSPRIPPVPKNIGGFLPFRIPIFAGLNATAALASGAAGIAKSINDTSAASASIE